MLTQLIKKAQSALDKVVGVAGGATGTGPDLTKPFEDRVAAFGDERWLDLKSAYITYHQIVWDALLKYGGILWIQWNNNTKTYDVVSSDDEWTPTPEVNRFSPAIDAMMSNFNTIPEIEAIPGKTDDMTAYAIADIATKLAHHAMKVNALLADFKGDEDKPGRAGALLTLAGTVFTHCFPEQTKIGEKPEMAVVPGLSVICPGCDSHQAIPLESVPDPSALAVCPQCGAATEVQPTEVPTQTGVIPIYKHSVRIDIGDPLFMLPRPGALSMNKMGYCIWAERMSTDEVFYRFGIEASPDQTYLDGYSNSYENALQYFYTGSASSTVRNKEEVMVVQLFIEPNKVRAVPEGCHAIYVNGKWQKIDQWQYIEHPLTKANYKNQPKLFFGRTDSFDLAKLQKESNHYEAIIKLHGMTSSSDSLLIDENTQVDEVTGRGDKIIKWRSLGPGSHPPARLQHGALDNGIYVQRDKIASEFQNVSGAVNVWRGEAPGSVTAASAIAQLRGQAEQMFATPEGNWNSLWTETVRKAVKILQQSMEPTEIAAIVGEGRDVEIDLFKKADLDTTLQFVSTKHGLPRTRDERRQEMITLWDHGALDPGDIHVREKLVDLFGETGMMQTFNVDATRARMENEQIKANSAQMGELQPMVGIEDLAVHYAIHSEQIKKLDFDKWDQAAKMLLINHTLDTKEALDLTNEMAAGGVPGDAPPPDEGKTAGSQSAPTSGADSVAGPKPAQQRGRGGKNGRRRAVGNRKDSPVPAANHNAPQIPTGPNGPGSSEIPGGNR